MDSLVARTESKLEELFAQFRSLEELLREELRKCTELRTELESASSRNAAKADDGGVSSSELLLLLQRLEVVEAQCVECGAELDRQRLQVEHAENVSASALKGAEELSVSVGRVETEVEACRKLAESESAARTEAMIEERLRVDAELGKLRASTADLRRQGQDNAALLSELHADVALLAADSHNHDSHVHTLNKHDHTEEEVVERVTHSIHDSEPAPAPDPDPDPAPAPEPPLLLLQPLEPEGTHEPKGKQMSRRVSKWGAVRAVAHTSVLTQKIQKRKPIPLHNNHEIVMEHDRLLRSIVRKVNAQGRCLQELVADLQARQALEEEQREQRLRLLAAQTPNPKDQGIALQCLSCLRPAPEAFPRLFEPHQGGAGAVNVNAEANGGMFTSVKGLHPTKSLKIHVATGQQQHQQAMTTAATMAHTPQQLRHQNRPLSPSVRPLSAVPATTSHSCSGGGGGRGAATSEKGVVTVPTKQHQQQHDKQHDKQVRIRPRSAGQQSSSQQQQQQHTLNRSSQAQGVVQGAGGGGGESVLDAVTRSLAASSPCGGVGGGVGGGVIWTPPSTPTGRGSSAAASLFPTTNRGRSAGDTSFRSGLTSALGGCPHGGGSGGCGYVRGGVSSSCGVVAGGEGCGGAVAQRFSPSPSRRLEANDDDNGVELDGESDDRRRFYLPGDGRRSNSNSTDILLDGQRNHGGGGGGGNGTVLEGVAHLAAVADMASIHASSIESGD